MSRARRLNDPRKLALFLQTVKSKFTPRKTRKLRSLVGKSKEAQQPQQRTSSGSSDTLNYEESLKSPTMMTTSSSNNNNHCVTDSVKIRSAEKPKRKTSFLAGSAPEFSGSWSNEVEGQKDVRTPKKSFIENGGSSVLPMATGYFPRPKEGQSLTSFLSSAQFARANAELDRENAHFSISEAMIAAMEQVGGSSFNE